MNKKLQKRLTTKPEKNGSAKTGTAKKRDNTEDFSISLEAKKQIFGFLVFMIGILSLFAVVSYSEKDQATLERFNFFDIFRKETYSNLYEIHNWLGVAGAFASDFLVGSFFGYFSIILSLLLILYGLVLIFKKAVSPLLPYTVYSLLLMTALGSTAGLSRILFGSNNISARYSGTTGDFFAAVFYQTLGSVGASIFFLLSTFLVVMLLIDGNIFTTMERLKGWFNSVKELIAKKKDGEEGKEEEETGEIIPVKQKKSEDSLSEALRKEREKILKTKYSDEEAEEEPDPIKETLIKRPVKEEAVAPKRSAKNKALKIDDVLAKDELKKEDISEIDINPENANEVDNLMSVDEDDFIEEKLEDYHFPEIGLLDEPSKEEFEVIPDEELNNNGRLLQEKLLKFGIEIEKVFATPGPVVTLYELIPAADVKLSKIESLQDDIALAMKAKGIRMIIPIPGKGTVGVEIPNSIAQMVRVRSILASQKYDSSKTKLPIAFGKTIDGEVFIDDLSKMPHVLIAGATGSGKSVGINTIIASLLYKLHPSDLKFVMVDPKKIELSLYTKLKKHFLATSTDINESIVTSPSNAVSILKSVELEMEHRYDKLANAGVRNIEAYNQKNEEGKLKNNEVIRHKKMPYIVVIIDELADLMITAKREIEEPIARIAQMARAVGIHLVVATQRPSVDVITGVIKANFPVRIAYQVASKIDSRTILDMGGADQLLRNGDMLYLSSASPKPIRIQNAYISTEECEKVVDFIGEQKGFTKPYLLPSLIEKRSLGGDSFDDRDELFEEAARLVLKLQQCSTSTLQRRLKLGYARAARIVDQMEQAGIVGPNQGAKGREILVTEDDLENIM